MTGNTDLRPTEETAVKPPEKVEETPVEEPSEADQFHPHKHGHVAIGTPDTAVTHLDPGSITFS
jgi:hypothetical protein